MVLGLFSRLWRLMPRGQERRPFATAALAGTVKWCETQKPRPNIQCQQLQQICDGDTQVNVINNTGP